MKLFAALGPGNIVEAQREQLSGLAVHNVTSIIFSGQLFEYCRLRGIEALFTSLHASPDELSTPLVRLVNVPKFWQDKSGWRFHVSQLVYAIRLAWMAHKFRADIALIDSGTSHYFALTVFWLLRIPIAVNLHNVRWPQGFEECNGLARIFRNLDSWFFRRVAIGATGCSPECGAQARSGGAQQLPYFGWSGQFRKEGFGAGNCPNERVPFNLLFVGRVERDKGVFDLIEISRLLKKSCSVPVIIRVCGDGSALADLRDAVCKRGETDRIILRGRLERSELLSEYGWAHAVIVPTRSDFCEGMPLVCAEAVLSGRPIVTSRLSNALPVLRSAIAEAEPENLLSYAEAVRLLAEDSKYYFTLQSACTHESRQFLDRSKSYPAALDRLFQEVIPGWQLLENYDAVFDSLIV